MGVFDFLSRRNGRNQPGDPPDTFSGPAAVSRPEERPVSSPAAVPQKPVTEQEQGINYLFQFLERNYEAKGYEDALVNADTVHLNQNLDALRHELGREIRKVKLFYEDFIREISFHIASRSRMGMVDTAEELMVKKETAETHLQQVIDMERELAEGRGMGQSIFLSYTRGFQNGLSAISHHSILRKNF